MLPLNPCHLVYCQIWSCKDQQEVSRHCHHQVRIKTLLNISQVSSHFHTSSADCNHYQIEQIMDWIISDPFPKLVLLFFSNWHICNCAVSNHVYTWLLFMKLAYEIENTEVLHFQLPLSLLCLYIVLCQIFLTILHSSSISSSVMMFSPFGMVPVLFSCIPLLYFQAYYMHNILHVSYSFCSN